MRRALTLLGMTLAIWAFPARAQDPQLQPLNVEPDLNGVNLITGQARYRGPVLQIPAAPNLRLERLADLLPFFTGTYDGGESGGGEGGQYSVNSGGAASENFNCTGSMCQAEQGTGSVLQANLSCTLSGQIVGGVNYYEARTRKHIIFSFNLGSSCASGQLARYALRVTYPNGEAIDFTYQTLSQQGGVLRRPIRIETNLGYAMVLEYRSDDIFQ